jgi:adenosylcobyric acid synthase
MAQQRAALAPRARFDDTARVKSSSVAEPTLAPVLMVQGTSSHAGKSTLVAALCRLFARAGYSVAPFKAQNMSNNAAVTAHGGEVGRAQAMQAAAARVPVTVDMNPVLLKPQSDRTSQVVVLGRATRANDAREYYDRTAELWPIVTGALDRLRAAHEIVVVEGAGSPAEINLERYDIVNMRVARHAQAPVLLVGDIDRGGVFASLFGTWALLPESDRALIRGYVINKFRGDPSLLDSGFEILKGRTGIPTLGVLPYLDLSRLPAEDALEWDALRRRANEHSLIDIAVLRLPRVANLDEFQALAAEPGVSLRFVGSVDDLGAPDAIIIPGTKSTIADLEWLRERGLAHAAAERRREGTPILGICGGYQMLGATIVDELGVESHGSAKGLELLPITTTFAAEKVTERVTARAASTNAFWPASTHTFDAYEIHMGRTTPLAGAALGAAPFTTTRDAVETSDGATSDDGLVVGTYMHGLLENEALRRAMLVNLAARKGITLPDAAPLATVDEAIDMLADAVARHLDLDAIGDMVGLPLGARV